MNCLLLLQTNAMPTSATAIISFASATSLLNQTLGYSIRTGTTTIATGVLSNPIAIEDITENISNAINLSATGYTSIHDSTSITVTAPLGLGSTVNGLDIYIVINPRYELVDTVVLNSSGTDFNLYEMIQVGDYVFGVGAETGNTTSLQNVAIHQIEVDSGNLETTLALAGDGDTPANEPHKGWITYDSVGDRLYIGGGDVVGKNQTYVVEPTIPATEDTTQTLATDYINTTSGRIFNGIFYVAPNSTCELYKWDAIPASDLTGLSSSGAHCFPDVMAYDTTRDKLWYRGATLDSPQGVNVLDIATNTVFDQAWQNFGTLVFRDLHYSPVSDCLYFAYLEDGAAKLMKLPASNTGVAIDKNSLPTDTLVYSLSSCVTNIDMFISELEDNGHIFVSVNCASPRLVIIESEDESGTIWQSFEGTVYNNLARMASGSDRMFVNKLTGNHSDIDIYELDGITASFFGTFSGGDGGTTTIVIGDSCSECLIVPIVCGADDLSVDANLGVNTSYIATVTDTHGVGYTQDVTTDGYGAFTLDLTAFPDGLFSPYDGMLELIVSSQVNGSAVTMNINGTDYDCIYVLTKIVNT